MSARVQASFSDFYRMVKDKKLHGCPMVFVPQLVDDNEIMDGIPSCKLETALKQFTDYKEEERFVMDKPHFTSKSFGSSLSKIKLLVFAHPKYPSFLSEWNSFFEKSKDSFLILRFKPFIVLESHTQEKFISNHTVLPGYLCHLYIKDTEYKVVDDRNIENENSNKNEHSPLVEDKFKPLNTTLHSTIGYRVISNITSLEQFSLIASHFPSTLSSFENIKEPPSLTRAVEKNSQVALENLGLIASEGILWINGKPKNLDNLNWFQLLNDIQDELELLTQLQKIDLNKSLALNFLKINLDPISSHLFNMSQLEHVVWLNDLENDKRYRSWPTSLRAFMMPTRSIPKVAKNVFNVLFFMDLTHHGHIEAVSEIIDNVRGNVPVRFGLVPMVDQNSQSNRSMLGVAFYKIYSESGLLNAIEWLSSKPMTSTFKDMDMSLHNSLLSQTQIFSVPLAGEFFINGEPFPFTFNYKHFLSEKIREQVGSLVKWLFYGEINDSVAASTIFYSKAQTWNSRHPFVFAEPKSFHFSSWNITTHDDSSPIVHVELRGLVEEDIINLFFKAQKDLNFAFEYTPAPTLSTLNELIVNGKNFGPLPKEFNFNVLSLLIKVESKTRLLPLFKKCSACQGDVRLFWKLSSFWWYNRLRDIQVASSYMRKFGDTENRMDPAALFDCSIKGACISLPSRPTPLIELHAFLDPVTELAQSIIPLLTSLSKALDFISLTVVWSKHTEKPLPNRFTCFVNPNEVTQACTLTNLPPILYTLALETPHAWGTFPLYSTLDLDNLILYQDHHAYFILRHLLVEGHAEDITTGSVPRGVQFVLTHSDISSHATEAQGTVVMANLGYFQLKAFPGTHVIHLRPGRSAEVYNPLSQTVHVDRLTGVKLFPKLEKKKGKEMESVLDPLEPSWWKKIVGYVRPNSDSKTIHVFSVASGHLYERFLSIMMQSVKNHTTSPVKFWLIEDFLSPSFKLFLPTLAKEIGFDFEFVSFAWPDWLNKQTVKQRTIWGYKILFLDVMFPLNLNRIIFVDADQIVRTDLAALRDLNLNGAVYGYTPFCNSRSNMENFRFWEHGYWKRHLDGKPYHISALYVINLALFRQLAAGDILRQQYQSLSNDPNSLANLDQDLPNALQHALPIYSLPQDWLWCETWCDDASLAKAKTIDLCNNPKTKEPKLDRARRLLPEWSVYDQRASELFEKVKKVIDVDPVGQGETHVLSNFLKSSFPSSSPDPSEHQKDEL
ncbi:hypothetical protein HMI54_001607 [Coelomomyces lativittatus]|nr:hypothetical protein HMI54_001607 [Coelomomyces lativittatus]